MVFIGFEFCRAQLQLFSGHGRRVQYFVCGYSWAVRSVGQLSVKPFETQRGTLVSKKKDLKKLLKRPDAFQTSVASGLERAFQYKGVIFTVIGAAVIGTIAIAGYERYKANQTNVRINELGKIESAFQQETDALNVERNKIREEVGKLSEPSADGKEPKLTAAQTQKKVELQKKLTSMVPDHSRTLGKYRDYYAKYKAYPEGWMAGMRAAGILIDGKQFGDAKDLLSEILQHSSDSLFYQINGRMLYINVLDELNELDPALAEVESLLREINKIDKMAQAAKKSRKDDKAQDFLNPADNLKPQVLLTKGRLLARKGDKESAQKVFSDIVENHKETDEARQAMSYKALTL